jgi:hypothetical protein
MYLQVMDKGFINTTVKSAEQMLATGISKQKILNYLVLAAEDILGKSAVCSILVLDNNGLLRNGASPGLPADYLKAIDGLKPSPKVGTCAAAAATGLVVITDSFLDDDKWTELRHLPMALGFVGAWSVPIKTTEGKVLGTFGTYTRKKTSLDQQAIDAVSMLALAAANVLSNSK